MKFNVCKHMKLFYIIILAVVVAIILFFLVKFFSIRVSRPVTISNTAQTSEKMSTFKKSLPNISLRR